MSAESETGTVSRRRVLQMAASIVPLHAHGRFGDALRRVAPQSIVRHGDGMNAPTPSRDTMAAWLAENAPDVTIEKMSRGRPLPSGRARPRRPRSRSPC